MKRQCHHKVVDTETKRTRNCWLPVQVERDGKWYCGRHDPEKRSDLDEYLDGVSGERMWRF